MSLEIRGRIMPASNATFLAELDGREVVYKPVAGERPLWDFPDGTLADREIAAYAVSEATGWGLVPRTWWGEGPHGPGMVQEWQEVDPDDDAVTLVRSGEVPDGWLEVVEGLDERDHPVTLVHEDSAALRRLAVYDVLVNNADRKGGHVLAMPGGHRYGVDHGVAFHHEPKLRTVLWGWAGLPLTSEETEVVTAVLAAVRGELGERLATHLAEHEIRALERRTERLLAAGVLPGPSGSWPAIPWPPF
ncbi:SCO1664 family protein [Nocardioides nitrophenolicus]|uniref:SCO1664 family protein n=1 Tax=Nocardioides nitrophenolicus TaxID=60489 RepID=UPI0027DD8883|nr:SCO1664 family protein [Nocardioides nitrophenolicus]MBM7520458.1 putative repeat protein (TIGR03843 family) [Nocardioides nitrophenolicus]